MKKITVKQIHEVDVSKNVQLRLDFMLSKRAIEKELNNPRVIEILTKLGEGDINYDIRSLVWNTELPKDWSDEEGLCYIVVNLSGSINLSSIQSASGRKIPTKKIMKEFDKEFSFCESVEFELCNNKIFFYIHQFTDSAMVIEFADIFQCIYDIKFGIDKIMEILQITNADLEFGVEVHPFMEKKRL